MARAEWWAGSSGAWGRSHRRVHPGPYSREQPAGSELGGRRGLCSRSSLAEVLSFLRTNITFTTCRKPSRCVSVFLLPAASPPDFSFHHLSFKIPDIP